MGEKAQESLMFEFDRLLRLEFHGDRLTVDVGLLACRELDGTLGLTEALPIYMRDTQGGRNTQHRIVPFVCQSVNSRLAGYEDTNNAARLAKDPAMCAVISRHALEKQAAGTSVLNRFETEVLATEENIRGLGNINAEWVDRAMIRIKHGRIILDMYSSESPVYGEQEGAAYNGHFGCVCYHPLFVFNQFGDCEGAMLRPGNVHSAEGWRLLLEPISARYDRSGIRKYFRGDAAFANPDIYKYLERNYFFYAIRLPSNEVLEREIQHLMKRPVGRPSKKPIIWYHSFQYQAASWERPRRVVAKVEWHPGELLPRVGFIVTNMVAKAKGVVHFYNGRGTAEQWIKEGKYALNWTRLSCHQFVANRVRLQLFILAYNLGNFVRRLGLPKAVKEWSLSSLQLKLIKTGARMVRHARYFLFQLAEAAMPRELFATILCRINNLRPAPA